MCQTSEKQLTNHCAPNTNSCLNKCNGQVKEQKIMILKNKNSNKETNG